jgi:hypothetical protein
MKINIFLFILSLFVFTISSESQNENVKIKRPNLTHILVGTYITAMVDPEFESMNNVEKLRILNSFRILLKRQLDVLVNTLYLHKAKLKAGKFKFFKRFILFLIFLSISFKIKKGMKMDEFLEFVRKRMI